MKAQGPTSDVARRAFDAIAAAQQVETLAELDLTLGRCLKEIGFETYVGVNVLDPGGRPNHHVIFGHTHQAWEEHYAARDFSAHDAVLREAMGGSIPCSGAMSPSGGRCRWKSCGSTRRPPSSASTRASSPPSTIWTAPSPGCC